MHTDDEQALLDLAVARGFLTPRQAQEVKTRWTLLRDQGRATPVGSLLAQLLSSAQVEALRQASDVAAAQARRLEANPGLQDQPTLAPGPESLGPGPRLPERLGAYRLERELARGGMGAVYVARHTGLDRQVALKVMLRADPLALKRFQIEARVTARLRHPNIVSIHEVGEQDGIHYLAMDLIEGMTLQKRLESGGPIPVREAAELTEKLAGALFYAHSHAILHRDLKPANVLLDAAGEPLITDFGIARFGEGEGLTQSGQQLGTPAYMAPEQARGAKDLVDRRTDVYALGLILYEMLTGRLPYEAEETLELLVAILHNPPLPPSKVLVGLERDLETICLKCLHKDPSSRYGSAEALASDLRSYLEGRPIAARRSSLLERARMSLRRRPLAAAFALGCVVSTLVALGLGQRIWTARNGREARLAQDRGSSLVATLRREGWEGPQGAAAQLALREAVRREPKLLRSWVLLARLAWEEGDQAEAERCLARARELGSLEGEGRYVEGCLLQAVGSSEEALLSLESAWDAGFRSPHLPLRLARARAAVYETRGWRVAAEEQRWRALREDPDQGSLWVAIVRERLGRNDVLGMAGLWTEVFRRLGRPAEPTLQRLQLGDYASIQAPLSDPKAPARERLRGALAALLYPRPATSEALLRLAHDAEVKAPILREAARATLLSEERLSVSLDRADARSASFAAWSRQSGAEGPAGALEAATLLEASTHLSLADLPALQALAGGPGSPLLRAGLALALALSGTREGGLPAPEAAALLERLCGDADPWVAERARVAAAALSVLRGGSQEVPEEALLLARDLWRAPRLAKALRAKGGYSSALARALRVSPSVRLHVAQAYDQIEDSDVARGRTGANAALKLDSQDPEAQTLALQLDLLEDRSTPTDSLVSPDPGVIRRARLRLEFTKAYGIVALPAANGALRLVMDFRGGHYYPDGLWVYGLGRRSYEGLAAEEDLTIQTRFACDRWDLVRVEGQGAHDSSVQVRAHAGARVGGSGGVSLSIRQRWGTSELCSDGQVGKREWRHGKRFAFLERGTLELGRGTGSLSFDGAALGTRVRGARARELPGNLALEFRHGGGQVQRLVLEGRWDGAGPASVERATAAERARFEARLRPLPDSRLLSEPWSERPSAVSFGDLRREGWRGKGNLSTWQKGRERIATAQVFPILRSFEVRARVSFNPQRNWSLAGLALFTLDGDVVFLAIGRGQHEPTVRVGIQRSGSPLATGITERKLDAAALLQPVKLRLQRVGDSVFARYQVAGASEIDLLEEPLHVPLDAAAGAALFAFDMHAAAPITEAKFSEVDVLLDVLAEEGEGQ